MNEDDNLLATINPEYVAWQTLLKALPDLFKAMVIICHFWITAILLSGDLLWLGFSDKDKMAAHLGACWETHFSLDGVLKCWPLNRKCDDFLMVLDSVYKYSCLVG